jgi:transcriptional regulator with XRE-family HTH domain
MGREPASRQYGAMTSEIGQRVGRRIKELREAAGLSQPRLGALVGKSAQTISRIENGAALPGLATLEVFARHLGVDIADIVTRTPLQDDHEADFSRQRMSELLDLLTSPERKIVGGVMGLLLSNRGR